MRNQTSNILGISIGTRKIGIAVLTGSELMVWETHVFAGWWSEAKETAILARFEKYLVRNSITAVAIKIPPIIPLDSPLQLILQKIQVVAGQYGCTITLYTKDDVKRHTRLNHMNSVFEYAVLHYPVLRSKYRKEKQSTTQHHLKMFEAVITAHLCKGAVRK